MPIPVLLVCIAALKAALDAVWVVATVVLEGWIPVFFGQALGGSPLRQFTLGLVVTMFSVARPQRTALP